ncbi:uncharacterized protein ARMOST_17383 [Armillaria ostoyae]|uniref:Uncharacterized protein n=1 Tax=Armillaria ostoyae TaxID=47428 RepID=A0A284RYU0_ARMOS|nr:uncharacterized protein ARMOST_17383 [Armillaria ostoyae]
MLVRMITLEYDFLLTKIDSIPPPSPIYTGFTTPPSTEPPVPQEIIDYILDLCILTSGNPKETVYNSSLASPVTKPRSQAHLFYSITINDEYPPAKWLDFFVGRQHLSTAITSLKIMTMEPSWEADLALLMTLLDMERTPLTVLTVANCDIRMLLRCGPFWSRVKRLYMIRCIHEPSSLLRWLQSLPAVREVFYIGDALVPLRPMPITTDLTVNAPLLPTLTTFMCQPAFTSHAANPVMWLPSQMMPVFKALSVLLFSVDPDQFHILTQIIATCGPTLECLSVTWRDWHRKTQPTLDLSKCIELKSLDFDDDQAPISTLLDAIDTLPRSGQQHEVTFQVKSSQNTVLPSDDALERLGRKVNSGQIVGIGGCCDVTYYSRWLMYNLLIPPMAVRTLQKCKFSRKEYHMTVTEEPYGDDAKTVIWDIHTGARLEESLKELMFPIYIG